MAFTSTRDSGGFGHWRLLVLLVPLFLAGVAEAGGRPDDGWSARGGATYWPSGWPIGIQREVAYSKHDIASAAINAINDAIAEIDPDLGSVSGGDVDDWNFSVTGIWSLDKGSSDGLYFLGGIGVDHVEASLTDTALVYYPPVCDPWWWWCTPGGVGPGTAVVAPESSTELSWHVGTGYSFSLNRGSVLFIEARYKSVQTDPRNSETLPVTLGIRW